MQGKVAIVTGGASGIGYATAKQFAQSGAHAVIADLDRSRGNDAKNELEMLGPESLFIEATLRAAKTFSGLFRKPSSVSAASTFWSTTLVCNTWRR